MPLKKAPRTITSSSPLRPFLITFEGIEGAGKSTQIKLFKEGLEASKNTRCHLFREPGGTPFGERMRKEVLEQCEGPLHPWTETLLLTASRCELLHKKVLPILSQSNPTEKKTFILLDRYIGSTLGYQGGGRGIPFEAIWELHSKAPLNLRPDLTFYLKIDLDLSEERMKLRGGPGDAMEKQGREFFSNVLNGFDDYAKKSPEVVSVDASRPVDQVAQAIWTHWLEFKKKKEEQKCLTHLEEGS